MDALGNYLNDHLAGAAAALALSRRLARMEEDTPLGHFLSELAEAIASDQGALEQIMELLRVPRRRVRRGLSWLAGQAAGLARAVAGPARSDFQRFRELELLALGVEGKRALWLALRKVAPAHPNLHGVDLDHLVRRADEQREQLEGWRLSAAVSALPGSPEREPSPLASPL